MKRIALAFRKLFAKKKEMPKGWFVVDESLKLTTGYSKREDCLGRVLQDWNE